MEHCKLKGGEWEEKLNASEEKLELVKAKCNEAHTQKRHALQAKIRTQEIADKRLAKMRIAEEDLAADRANTAAFWAARELSLQPKDVATMATSGSGRAYSTSFERPCRWGL